MSCKQLSSSDDTTIGMNCWHVNHRYVSKGFRSMTCESLIRAWMLLLYVNWLHTNPLTFTWTEEGFQTPKTLTELNNRSLISASTLLNVTLRLNMFYWSQKHRYDTSIVKLTLVSLRSNTIYGSQKHRYEAIDKHIPFN